MTSIVKRKAGIIPYIITDKGIEMLFMVSSDARYGGPDPMISKGNIDEGEDTLIAAIREGNEELGLVPSNLACCPFLVTVFEYGDPFKYSIHVYAAEVRDKATFVPFHYETAETVWMTMDEFNKTGRELHRPIVNKLIQQLSDQQLAHQVGELLEGVHRQ